jgi:hypothetical protein
MMNGQKSIKLWTHVIIQKVLVPKAKNGRKQINKKDYVWEYIYNVEGNGCDYSICIYKYTQEMSTYEFTDWSSISVTNITHQQGNVGHNHSVVEAETV